MQDAQALSVKVSSTLAVTDMRRERERAVPMVNGAIVPALLFILDKADRQR